MAEAACRAVRAGALVAALLLPVASGAAVLSTPAAQDIPHRVVYEGTAGPGLGKHIVLIAAEHEYRAEEILPAMGRILAKNFGFRCSVFFTLDAEGFIEPGSSNIAGLEALDTADLVIVGLRFQDFPAAEMPRGWTIKHRPCQAA